MTDTRAGSPAAVLSWLPGSARLLLTSDLAAAAGIGLTQPYLVVLLHGVRGLPLALSTGMVALAAITSLAGNPVAGRLIDRRGPRTVMISGLVVAAAGMLLVATGRSVAGVVITGLGWSLSIPALATRLARLTAPGAHERISTLQYVLFNFGLAGGATAGGLVLASPSGSAALPWLWGVAALICLSSIALATRHDPVVRRCVPAPPQERGYRRALSDRGLSRILGATVLLATVGYGIYNAVPSVLALAADDPVALAWANVGNELTVVAGAAVVWRFTDRIDARIALLSTAAAWALAWAICVPAALGAGAAVRPALALAGVLTGAGEVLFAGALPTLVNAVAPDELRGHYQQLSSLAMTAGMVVGPLLTAVATACGATIALLDLAILCCGAAGALLCLPPLGNPPR